MRRLSLVISSAGKSTQPRSTGLSVFHNPVILFVAFAHQLLECIDLPLDCHRALRSQGLRAITASDRHFLVSRIVIDQSGIATRNETLTVLRCVARPGPSMPVQSAGSPPTSAGTVRDAAYGSVIGAGQRELPCVVCGQPCNCTFFDVDSVTLGIYRCRRLLQSGTILRTPVEKAGVFLRPNELVRPAAAPLVRRLRRHCHLDSAQKGRELTAKSPGRKGSRLRLTLTDDVGRESDASEEALPHVETHHH
jgi:hypothetical protein